MCVVFRVASAVVISGGLMSRCMMHVVSVMQEYFLVEFLALRYQDGAAAGLISSLWPSNMMKCHQDR